MKLDKGKGSSLNNDTSLVEFSLIYFLNSWEKLCCFDFGTIEIIYITFVIVAIINEKMIMNYIIIY